MFIYSSVAAIVIAAFTASPAQLGETQATIMAADVTMQEGVVVSAEQNKLVIADKHKAQHSYTVDEKVPVHINGKQGKLEDLKKTALVTVTIAKDGKVTHVATVDLMKKLADSRRYWR